MTEAGPAADMTIWNASLDGSRLTAFFKGRGIGDCGQISEWRIDAEASALFLVESRVKDECAARGRTTGGLAARLAEGVSRDAGRWNRSADNAFS